MIDDNWELVEGDAAHAIEVLNYSNTVNVIEALVHLWMHHARGKDGSCVVAPHLGVLREFHRTATLFLLHTPGEYRQEQVVVRRGDGTVVHTPPPHTEVEAYLERLSKDLNDRWAQQTPQELAAFALWMVNWVHPFKNGNGRTARAFCYACLSLKFGFVLPGSPTVIDLIMRNRDQYQTALKTADIAFEAGNDPDLTAMVDFIDGLLAEQFASIP